MKKKKIVALAMFAVMVAGTMPVPANATDFSDGMTGIETQEAAEIEDFRAGEDEQTVENAEIIPDDAGLTIKSVGAKEQRDIESDSPSLVITVTTDEGTSDVIITDGFTKETQPATCRQEGGYTWAISYLGIPEYTFESDFVKTSEKTDHVFIDIAQTVIPPSCITETDGLKIIMKYCKYCPAMSGPQREESIPYSHTWDSTTVTYVTGENTEYVNNDNTLPPVLGSDGKSGFYTKNTSQHCSVCDRTIETSETIHLYAENYTGVAEIDGGQFFVVNGEICEYAQGLNLYDGQWYYLANGQVQNQYTGLVEYDGEWFYITDGKLDVTVTRVVSYDGGLFVVAAGRILREVNGLWLNPDDSKWYFAAEGQVQNQYTGVAQYDGAFFYVVNGVLDSGYNGTVTYDGATFKVVNGMLQV